MRIHRLTRRVSLLLVLIPCLNVAAAAGDTEADTLKQILTEMRQLRCTVELATRTHLKAQVVAARLSIREERVRSLRQQADRIEEQLAANTVDLERSRNELMQLDGKLSDETGAEARQELTAQRNALADSIAQLSSQNQENQRRAATIANNLDTEKTEFERLLQELIALENSLEAQGAGSAASSCSEPRH
jgi:hypothetical protein